jgi:hypothetical protein
MKKEKEFLFPNEFAGTSFIPGLEPNHNEYVNFSNIGTDGVYDHQFEEEYENYNSDYDLNTK